MTNVRLKMNPDSGVLSWKKSLGSILSSGILHKGYLPSSRRRESWTG